MASRYDIKGKTKAMRKNKKRLYPNAKKVNERFFGKKIF